MSGSPFLKRVLFAICLCMPILAFANAQAEVPICKDFRQGVFLKSWLICEPIPVFPGKSDPSEDEAQVKAFEQGPPTADELATGLRTGKLSVDQKDYKWNRVDSASDTVDLAKVFGQKEFAYVYALVRIEAAESGRALVGVGSDDGIQIWLNDRLVHHNWMARAMREDQDVLCLSLRKGSNLLLVKVQNTVLGWGFSIRPLTEAAIKERFIEAAARGDTDLVKLFLENNVGVNTENSIGLTPLHAATIAGRKQIVDLLLKNNADAAIPMPSKEKIVDYLFTRAIERNGPGSAFLVSQDGQIVKKNGFGMANAAKGIPITAESTFRIGSITKQFTAAAILKLVESGKMSLSDPLSKYIPDFPRGNEVTIHHLLTHTSGIHSYTEVPDFLENVLKPIGEEALISRIKGYQYDFDPGTAWRYNNSGYFILGHIIELVSGESYASFLKTHIFEPLGMENTGIYTKDVTFDREALGYSYNWYIFNRALDWDMSWAGPAGSLYSNVQDLYRWNEAVFSGRVLSQQMREVAFSPVQLEGGKPAEAFGGGYGYGWSILKLRGLNVIGHGGGLHGFNTFLMRIPEENLTVVVLSNSLPTVPGFSSAEAAMQVAQAYLWKTMQNQPCYETHEIDPAVLDEYAGKYDYGAGIIMRVVTAGDHLFAGPTGQGVNEIFPGGKDEFFWKVGEATISFVRDAKGIVTAAFHRQGGSSFTAPRVK